MELRTRMLLPFVTATVLIPLSVIAEREFGTNAYVIGLAATVVLLVIGMAYLLVHVVSPIKTIQVLLNRLPESLASQSLRGGSTNLDALAKETAQTLQLIQDRDEKLTAAMSRAQHLEHSLREVEARHEMMLISSNDGLWDWDVKTGRIEFSIRWQGMLGYLGECPANFTAWQQLLHPDDREAVLLRLANHIDGLAPRFDMEYRVRHRDGHYHWVHSRGTALRHANGKAYRAMVLDNDIHQRKVLEQTLIQAAEGLSSVSGQEFFHALMVTLSSILNTRDNLVCYCLDDPPGRARTLAYYTRGAFAQENFEYELDGTSCGAVIERKEIVYCPTGVCDIWPVEKQYDRDSYLGVPMFDSNGKIIGHFACMDGGPMQHDLPHLALFKIFSVRAAAELERTLLKERLNTSNLQLTKADSA